MDVTKLNQSAWDKKVEDDSPYTRPVSREMIEKTRTGAWGITVTTERAVPRDWFPASIAGLKSFV